jgi:dTDP-4-amino-4,6-dideoxygalactose transaminase
MGGMTDTDRIEMVDVLGQYRRIQEEVDEALREVIESSRFIRGPIVASFERELATYLGGRHAIGVGNGTDALQVALMAIGIGPGDEVITTAFSFVAAAEVVALLGATPVFADINPDSFNLDANGVEALVNERTKAIIPVHLYGQPADMSSIMDLAASRNLYVIEDNAQAIGAQIDGVKTGYIGHLGCLSFFPSKNLGAFGDGGGILTNDDELAAAVRTIANHGADRKYHNHKIGVNSRLDAIQAAILRVKLKHLDAYAAARQSAADRYDRLFSDMDGLQVPARLPDRSHVFHQYTIRVLGADAERRDKLAAFLADRGVPTSVYYPIAIHRLDAYRSGQRPSVDLAEAELASAEVLSLPMHTELTEEQQVWIADCIGKFLTDK